MKPFVVFGLLVVVTIAFAGKLQVHEKGLTLDDEGKIINGYPIDIKEVPHQLSMQIDGRHICGASLISENQAITAAHCTAGLEDRNIKVRAGSHLYKSGGKLFKVLEFINHPGYDEVTAENDIAIIKLDSSNATLPKVVKPVALVEADETIEDGTMCIISGWGTTVSSHIKIPTQLQAIDIPIVNFNECKNSYDRYKDPIKLTETNICAGLYEGGKASCMGDSGGGLITEKERKLIGVVSWGSGFCENWRAYGVYADVRDFRDWIREHSGV